MNVSDIHQKLLRSKEQTFSEKLTIITKHNKPLISLAINIPGWPKTSDMLRKFFFEILAELKVYCLANRLLIDKNTENIIENDNGLAFFSTFSNPTSTSEAKKITERFESDHELGRFIDVDVLTSEGKPVSGNKEKKCFYCKEYSAINCMRNNRHSHVELKQFQEAEVHRYLIKKEQKQQSEILSELILYALLKEISLDPKPGLVSPSDSGSHTDMDYHTFIQSTAAISNVFNDLFHSILVQNKFFSFEDLRAIGIDAELKMTRATGNINTHKGAVFLLIILGYSIAKLISANQELSDSNIKNILAKFNQHIVFDPLNSIDPTHGNKVRKNKATSETGIKAELVNGLPSLFQNGIVILRKYYFSASNDASRQKYILTLSLLKIMSVNNDTNILYRGNTQKLNQLKKKSLRCTYAIENNNWLPYEDLCKWTKNENLSPGGSADILAATIFTYLCQINPNLRPNEL